MPVKAGPVVMRALLQGAVHILVEERPELPCLDIVKHNPDHHTDNKGQQQHLGRQRTISQK